MIDEIIASRADGELRVALREHGRLMEVLFDSGAEPGTVGDIVLGRVTAVLKGMEACFVDIGAEKAGFLSLAARGGDENVSLVRDAPTEGAVVLVQVTKAAQAGKGCGLTRAISIAGRFLVLTPGQPRIAVSRRIEDEGLRARLEEMLGPIAGPDEGFIVRTAAADATAEALAADAESLRARWDAIQDSMGNVDVPACLHGGGSVLTAALRDRAHDGIRRIIVDTRADEDDARAFFAMYLPALAARVERWQGVESVFEALGVEDDIAEALEPVVALPCGGSLIIEETHALAAVDVNTGRNTGRSGHADTVRATNLEAADEIARQLRLRNLGGLTVVDFVHMDDPAHRQEVYDALMGALVDDPAFIRATGFSELGLIELARRRGAGPLSDRYESSLGGEGD